MCAATRSLLRVQLVLSVRIGYSLSSTSRGWDEDKSIMPAVGNRAAPTVSTAWWRRVGVEGDGACKMALWSCLGLGRVLDVLKIVACVRWVLSALVLAKREACRVEVEKSEFALARVRYNTSFTRRHSVHSNGIMLLL